MRLLSKIVVVLLCIWTEAIHAKSIEFIDIDRQLLKWKKIPQILINSSLLQDKDRDLNILIYVNEKGEVIASKINKSSGIVELDALVAAELKKSNFYPYQLNGKYYPVRVEQPFEFYINGKQMDDSVLTESDRSKSIEEKIHKEIMSLWEVPTGSTNLSNIVRFNISRNNAIDSIQVLQSSGNRIFDLSTRQAVRHSTIVSNLTHAEKNDFFAGLDSRTITIVFRSK